MYGRSRPARTTFRTAVPRWFADTEEDGGSTPPAPTTPAVTRAFALWLVPLVGGDCAARTSSVERALNCLTKGVLFGEKQAGPAVDIGGRTSSGLAGQLNLTSCGNLVAAQPVHAVGLAGGGPEEPILQPLGPLQRAEVLGQQQPRDLAWK